MSSREPLGGPWDGRMDAQVGHEFVWQADGCHASPPIGPDPPAQAEPDLGGLMRTIEAEIVPRLVLARRAAAARSGPRHACIEAADVDEAVRLLLEHEAPFTLGLVETLRQRGVSLEMICLELLAPAARKLGQLWEEDACDFLQVTVGMCRLHQVLRELSSEFRSETAELPGHRRILLATCPGEQHTFGLALVAQFLRRAGWEVWHEFPTSIEEVRSIAARHWFAVVGFSLASEVRLQTLSESIAEVRDCAKNRGIGVLVGGSLMVSRPELAPRVGADATAASGALAVTRADDMFRALAAAH
ncbi:MAG: cobalamin-dependent protein [Gammaproteobacteria bacterium]|nr:cobalamin-dependent protein [Gammaproteobacteria bacterium]